MKKVLILSMAVFLVKAMMVPACPVSTEPLTGNGNSIPDTVKKRASHPFPGFPGQFTSTEKKKIFPFGTLKIRSDIPARFTYDEDTTLTMIPYQLVVIYKVPVGQHTLTFHDSLMERRKTIIVDSMTTGYYKLLKDSTISDSVSRGKFEPGHKHHILSWYEPFKHAISFDFLPGAFFNGRGIGPNIRFEIGYNFNRVFKLGIGTGYVNYPTHLKYTSYGWLLTPIGTYESDNFGFPFIPVYLDISLNFKSNRTTTFLNFNLGASFPMAGSISCKSTYDGSNYSGSPYQSSEYYLKIDKIETGFYFGLVAGMKYFFTPFFEGGLAAGFNLSLNTIKGKYYENADYTRSQMEQVAPHVTTGFGINLVLGFNLDTN